VTLAKKPGKTQKLDSEAGLKRTGDSSPSALDQQVLGCCPWGWGNAAMMQEMSDGSLSTVDDGPYNTDIRPGVPHLTHSPQKLDQ
jgi:hypothetical protein